MDPYRETKTPEYFGEYQVRELTADGIPIDASLAVPTSFNLDEMPVYRSINIMRDAGSTPSLVVATPLRLKEELRDPQNEQSNQSEVSVPVELKPNIKIEVGPPSLESLLCPPERTHFEVSESLESVQQKIQSFCDDQCVQVEQKGFEYVCSGLGDESFDSCEFRINLFTKENRYVVEFQRRSGDSMFFNSIFRSAKARFHNCATQAPALLSRPMPMSLDFQPAPAEAEQEWNCLLNWMQSDTREAIRAIGGLASQGASVPNSVMDALVNELSSEFRVDALRAITAAVPKHTLAGHEDQVFAAVLQCMNSGLLEQKQAWKFVSKVADALPGVLSSRKIDDRVIDQALESRWVCIQQFAQSASHVIQCQS